MNSTSSTDSRKSTSDSTTSTCHTTMPTLGGAISMSTADVSSSPGRICFRNATLSRQPSFDHGGEGRLSSTQVRLFNEGTFLIHFCNSWPTVFTLNEVFPIHKWYFKFWSVFLCWCLSNFVVDLIYDCAFGCKPTDSVQDVLVNREQRRAQNQTLISFASRARR